MPLNRHAVVGLSILMLVLVLATFNREYHWIDESNRVFAWFAADPSGRRLMGTILLGIWFTSGGPNQNNEPML